MIEAVIFDLDGVIVRTDEQHYRAWKALADSLGVPFDRSKNDRLRGVSRIVSLEIVLEDSGRTFSEEEKAVLAAQKNEIYVRLLQSITPADALTGVVDVLHALKDGGTKIAVGSSSKNTKHILGKLGLLELFDAIADGTDITHSKPHPEVFLCAAKKLGLAPALCAVVEDASAGIQAAKAAGMLAVGFGGDACTDPDADAVISHPSELLDLVRKQSKPSRK